MATTLKTKKLSDSRSNKIIWALIGVIMLVVFFAAMSLFSDLTKQDTYFVLNKDVPFAKTQITVSDLQEVSVREGTAPPTALNIAEVQSGDVYSKIPLNKGDILTASNTGPNLDISVGVPDSWVITNFSVSADDAVQGRIQRGYYFDMIVTTTVTGDDTHASSTFSFYPFINMLALDTTVSLNNASNSNAINTDAARAGQTKQYTVGLPRAEAARLHSIMEQYGGNVHLVLTPRQNDYCTVNPDEYAGQFGFDVNKDGPFNAGQNTNSNFTDVERDAGVPIGAVCSDGSDPVRNAENPTANPNGSVEDANKTPDSNLYELDQNGDVVTEEKDGVTVPKVHTKGDVTPRSELTPDQLFSIPLLKDGQTNAPTSTDENSNNAASSDANSDQSNTSNDSVFNQ